jgi:hypothetical protein
LVDLTPRDPSTIGPLTQTDSCAWLGVGKLNTGGHGMFSRLNTGQRGTSVGHPSHTLGNSLQREGLQRL